MYVCYIYIQDDRYDYNYQQARELTKEVTVYPGDELITECVYNTEDRPQLTHVSIPNIKMYTTISHQLQKIFWIIIPPITF